MAKEDFKHLLIKYLDLSLYEKIGKLWIPTKNKFCYIDILLSLPKKIGRQWIKSYFLFKFRFYFPAKRNSIISINDLDLLLSKNIGR